MKEKTVKFFLIIIMGFTSLTSIQATSDTDKDLIEGIDYDIFEVVVPIEENSHNEGDDLTISLRILPGYSIRNKKTLGTMGTALSPSAEGQPGGTIRLGFSTTVNYTVSLTIGVGVGDVEAAFGQSISQSETVTTGYDWAVPHTYNGKKVRSAKVTAYAEAQILGYDIYFLESAVLKNGRAYKLTNIKYVVTVNYY